MNLHHLETLSIPERALFARREQRSTCGRWKLKGLRRWSDLLCSALGTQLSHCLRHCVADSSPKRELLKPFNVALSRPALSTPSFQALRPASTRREGESSAWTAQPPFPIKRRSPGQALCSPST